MPMLGLFRHLSKIGATTRRIAIALGARSESRFTRPALVLQTNKVKSKIVCPSRSLLGATVNGGAAVIGEVFIAVP
jgi:hypothetical protein